VTYIPRRQNGGKATMECTDLAVTGRSRACVQAPSRKSILGRQTDQPRQAAEAEEFEIEQMCSNLIRLVLFPRIRAALRLITHCSEVSRACESSGGKKALPMFFALSAPWNSGFRPQPSCRFGDPPTRQVPRELPEFAIGSFCSLRRCQNAEAVFNQRIINFPQRNRDLAR